MEIQASREFGPETGCRQTASSASLYGLCRVISPRVRTHAISGGWALPAGLSDANGGGLGPNTPTFGPASLMRLFQFPFPTSGDRFDNGRDRLARYIEVYYCRHRRRIARFLKGDLSLEGCVAKITGLKQTSITGPVRVLDYVFPAPHCLRPPVAL